MQIEFAGMLALGRALLMYEGRDVTPLVKVSTPEVDTLKVLTVLPLN